MFKHIVALNTYTEPFLSLRANDQRTIIEQLLGITMLSEKADALKEQLKETKNAITEEEYRIKAVQEANERVQEQIEATKRRQTLWQSKKQEDIDKLAKALENLDSIDIEAELAAHDALNTHSKISKEIKEVSKWRASGEQESARLEKHINSLKSEIEKLERHECYACGQEIHDEKHQEVLDKKREILKETETQYHESQEKVQIQVDRLAELGDPGPIPNVFYDSKEDAIGHKNTIENLTNQLEAKLAELDPYAEQITEMETQAVQEIEYNNINELVNVREHQDFLLKLLTNKDSFIRKRIIDQNLTYLNVRLSQYLDRIGLPHTVKFNNDLTVTIEELGRELDFDNLSRGERNRLILSLSWAFRDVWESLYQQINLLFIDEVIDTGMDSSGVENSLAILKKMAREGHRSVWLVSHKDELAGRVNNVLNVVKENGFTTYMNDVEIS
jgi:DNA repair exonuclease SbcCD ATPase subunit